MIKRWNVLRLIWHALAFWGGAMLLILQAERLLLLPEVATMEPPTPSLLAKAFFVGMCNDLLAIMAGIALALLVAGIATGVWRLYRPMPTVQQFCDEYRRMFIALCIFLLIALGAIVSVDI